MAESDKTNAMAQPALTASISGLLIALFSICSPEQTSEHLKQAFSLLSAVVSPFLVLFLMRWYHKEDMPAELMRVIGFLEKDLSFQRKQLERKDLTSEMRISINTKIEKTLNRRSTIHQDFFDGKIQVVEDTIKNN